MRQATFSHDKGSGSKKTFCPAVTTCPHSLPERVWADCVEARAPVLVSKRGPLWHCGVLEEGPSEGLLSKPAMNRVETSGSRRSSLRGSPAAETKSASHLRMSSSEVSAIHCEGEAVAETRP